MLRIVLIIFVLAALGACTPKSFESDALIALTEQGASATPGDAETKSAPLTDELIEQNTRLTFAPYREFETKLETFLAAAISWDDETVAIVGSTKGSDDNDKDTIANRTLELWDVASSSHLHSVELSKAPIRSVAFSRDDKSVFLLGDQAEVDVRSVKAPEDSQKIALSQPATKLLVGAEGEVSLLMKDGSIESRDPSDWKLKHRIKSEQGAILDFALATRSNQLLSVTASRAELWSQKSGERVRLLIPEELTKLVEDGADNVEFLLWKEHFYHCDLSPDGQEAIVFVNSGKTLFIEDTSQPEQAHISYEEGFGNYRYDNWLKRSIFRENEYDRGRQLLFPPYFPLGNFRETLRERRWTLKPLSRLREKSLEENEEDPEVEQYRTIVALEEYSHPSEWHISMNTQTWKPRYSTLRRLLGHSHDRLSILTQREDSGVILSRPLPTIEYPQPTDFSDWSRNEERTRYLNLHAIHGKDGDLRLIDLDSDEPIAILKQNPVAGQFTKFLQGGELLVSAGLDGTIWLWDVKRRKRLGRFESNLEGSLHVNVSHDRSTLAASSEGWISGGGSIRVWSITTGRRLLTVNDVGRNVHGPTLSPDGARVFYVDKNGDLILHETQPLGEKQIIDPFKGEGNRNATATFSPSGSKLALAAWFKGLTPALKVWDLKSGKLELFEQYREADSLFFSEDEKYLALVHYQRMSLLRLEDEVVLDIKDWPDHETLDLSMDIFSHDEARFDAARVAALNQLSAKWERETGSGWGKSYARIRSPFPLRNGNRPLYGVSGHALLWGRDSSADLLPISADLPVRTFGDPSNDYYPSWNNGKWLKVPEKDAFLFVGLSTVLYDGASTQELRMFNRPSFYEQEQYLPGEFKSARLSADGKRLALGLARGDIWVWDMEEWRPIARDSAEGRVEYNDWPRYPYIFNFVPDTNTLLVVNRSKAVEFLDATNLEPKEAYFALKLFVQDEDDPSKVIAFSDDSSKVAALSAAREVTLLDTRNGKLIKKWQLPRRAEKWVFDIKFSPSGDSLAIVHSGGTFIYDLCSDTLVNSIDLVGSQHGYRLEYYFMDEKRLVMRVPNSHRPTAYIWKFRD